MSCAEYGWQDSVTIEHVVPLSQGGSNIFWNRVAACHRCNFNRGTMNADEFAAIAKHYKPDRRPSAEALAELKRKNRQARIARRQAARCPQSEPLPWWERVIAWMPWYALLVVV